MYIFQIIETDLGFQYNYENISVFFGNKKLLPQDLNKHFKNIEFQFLNQKHSTNIDNLDRRLDVADGFQWSNTNFSAVVRTADCLPLIVFDHEIQKLTNLHCGRKGLVDGILQNLLELTDTDHTFSFFIGPHIQTYEIGPDLYKELSSKNINSLFIKEDKYYFSLSEFTKKFISSQFKNYKLYETPINTLINNDYWSYRANKSTPERNLSFAYIEEK